MTKTMAALSGKRGIRRTRLPERRLSLAECRRELGAERDAKEKEMDAVEDMQEIILSILRMPRVESD